MSHSPRVGRIRHELKRRRLTVKRVAPIAPQMVRITFGGESLSDFASLGFDDHVKLFFPADDPAAPVMRDFTPRRFDTQASELDIDFFLHDAGPATSWAAQASVGQELDVAGPRGSAVIALDGIDAHVLIGDETALPAIQRRLEELPHDTRALVVIEHDAGVQWPALSSRAQLETLWVPRDGRIDPPAHELIDALRETDFPAGSCFVWVAVESRAARAIRRYLREERGLDKQWIKAAGYWQRGSAGAHDVIGDTE